MKQTRFIFNIVLVVIQSFAIKTPRSVFNKFPDNRRKDLRVLRTIGKKLRKKIVHRIFIFLVDSFTLPLDILPKTIYPYVYSGIINFFMKLFTFYVSLHLSDHVSVVRIVK